MTCNKLASISTLGLLLGVTPWASAQDVPEERFLDEVVVTAERRSQNLQEVPISVTVFNSNDIKDGRITNMSDLAKETPNLKMSTFNIGEPQIYLRGIGNTNDSVASDPAVAVFLDDVYIGRPGATTFDLYDLDRIEVLRGPQGTLYGKNATGGAIGIYTKRPSEDFEIKAGATVGSDNLQVLRFYVNGAISDTVNGKFTATSRERDGYSQNIVTGLDLDDESNLSARGQILIDAREDVEVLLGFDYTDEDPNGNCRTLGKLDVSPQPFGGAFIPTLVAISNPPRTCTHSIIDESEKTIFGLLARIDWDTGGGTLSSITGYRESDLRWRQMLGGQDSPPNLLSVDDGADEEADQISQEFRFASDGGDNFNWVAGLYFMEENANRREQFITNFTFPAFVPFSGTVDFLQDNKTTSYAAFGQATWNVSDVFAITVGGRWTEDEKSITQSANDLINDGTPAAIPLGPGTTYGPVSAKNSWSQFTPRLSLDWRATDDHLLYVTWAEGYKSGVFPSQATSAAVATTSLEPEEVTSLEIGAKTEWLDNRLRVNAAYFTMDYEQLQVFQLINLQLVAENAEEASVDGIEIEAAFAVTEDLTIAGGYGNTDSNYDNYVVTNPNTGTVVDNTGNELARSPDETWTLAVNYLAELQNGGQFEFNAGWAHTGDYFHEPTNDVRSFQESHSVIDAFVRYGAPDNRWDLTVWGKNLNDELYIAHMINSTFGGAVEIYAPPRTYGATFNYYWN